MNTLTTLPAMPELSRAWLKLQDCSSMRTINNSTDFAAMREVADSLAATGMANHTSAPIFCFEIERLV